MKSLECQQNFVDLLESNIKSLFSIPESIRKYQDATSNTNVRINYAVGIGLYMIPSNLVLQVGVIQKYNNNIVIADDSREIGENEDINPLDSAAAVNPLDSVEAVKPVDSAATVKRRDSAEAVNPVDSVEAVKSRDSAAAVNPKDSVEAVKPVDSATPLDSVPEQHSTRISPAEIGAGIAFVVFILFLTLSS